MSGTAEKFPRSLHKKIKQPPNEIQQEILTEKIEQPLKEIQKETPFSASVKSDTTENVLFPATPSPQPEPPGIVSSLSNCPSRKTAVYGILALVVIMVVITAIFVILPSGSHGFDLSSLGMNSTSPELKATTTAIQPLAKTTAVPIVTGTHITPLQTPTPVQTYAIPEQIPTTEVPFSKPAFVPAPGDPATVIVSYLSLFNTGNGAGLAALSSESMKSHYPLDMVNKELASARSKGYSIEKIQVNNQIIEENTAILEVDILWKVAGSPVTSSPRVFLVYENNQWKLDSLVVSPYVS